MLNQFLGMDTLTKWVAGTQYEYDLRNHWDTATVVNPLALGYPVVKERVLYCLGLAAVEQYECSYLYNGVQHDVDQKLISSNADLVIEVSDELSAFGGEQPTVSSIPSTGVPHAYAIYPHVGWAGDDAVAPKQTFGLTLKESGNTIANAWEVYSAAQAAQMGLSGPVYDSFDALVFGRNTIESATPVSTINQMELILRDPPGDGSSMTLESGATYSKSKVISESKTQDGASSLTFSAGYDIETEVTAGVFIGLGGGVITAVSVGNEISTTLDITAGATYGGASNSSDESTTELTFNQAISTSGDEQDGTGGSNQDLFFGKTENILMSKEKVFGLESVFEHDTDAAVDGSSLPYLSFNRVGTNQDQDASKRIYLGWKDATAVQPGPASWFLKTELEIEQYNIPNLEALRNAYFTAHVGDNGNQLYAPLEPWQEESSQPEGMYLANNDDPRWLLFHSAVANAHANLKPTAPLFYANYSTSEMSGLGYTFVGGSDDRVLKDSVRYYNDIITSWKKMLAQNELDKLNARALILSQIDNIDNLDELNPGGIADAADDNGAATSEIGLTSMGQIYDAFDFEPYFIIFSGGGGVFSQSYTKTSISTTTDVSSNYAGWNAGGEVGFAYNSLGFAAATEYSEEYGWETESSQTNEGSLTFSYELVDDDENDFQYVAVMPGHGADGPIFLNLGSAPSSCPWDAGEVGDYYEYYPFLSDELERMVAQSTLCPTKSVLTSRFALTLPDGSVEHINVPFATTEMATRYLSGAAGWASGLSSVTSMTQLGSSTTSTITSNGSWNLDPSVCTSIANGTELEVQPPQLMLDSVQLTTVDGTLSYSGNINDPIVVNLNVQHIADYAFGADYNLGIETGGNAMAANISMDGGSNSTFIANLLPSSPAIIPVEITANGLTDLEYLNGQITFRVSSDCDDQQVFDLLTINVSFDPVCSPITLTTPESNWFVNTNQIVSASNSVSQGGESSVFNFYLEGINTRLQNFCTDTVQAGCGNDHAIALQYLRSTSVSSSDIGWQTFATFTREEIQDHPSIEHIGYVDTMFTFTEVFGPVSPFEDPNVQFRAKTVCELYQESISNVVAGQIDKVRPDVFGDALPLDGVFEPNDELTIRFNEAMNPASVNVGDIVLEGKFNGLNPWAGAFGFDGSESIEVLDAPNIMDNDWLATLQVWPEGTGSTIDPALSGTVLYQGDANHHLRIYLDGDSVFAHVQTDNTSETQSIGSTDAWLPNYWNKLAIGASFQQYDDDGNPEMKLFVDSVPNPMASVFTLPRGIVSTLLVGNDPDGTTPLNASVKDLRMWQDNWGVPGSSSYDIAAAPQQTRLTGTETGLSLWLPSTEMAGVPEDHARGRALDFDAHWELPEGGFALQGDADTEALSMSLLSTSVASMSLEFWFKPSTLNQEQTIVSDAQNWFFMVTSEGRFEALYESDVEGTASYVSTSQLEPRWYHVAVVGEDGSTVRVYLDGEEVSSGAPADRFAITTVHLDGHNNVSNTTQSYWSATSTTHFDGWLDEVRVWRKALTVDELTLRRHERLSALPGLLAYAPFDSLDAAGTQAVARAAFLAENADGSYAWADWSSSAANSLTDTAYAFIPLESQSTETAGVSAISFNAGNDEFILEFAEDKLWQYEDQIIQLTLKETVSDVIGNDMSAPDTWKFLFDLHPLKIDANDWSVESLVGESHSTTFTLHNTGLEMEPYELVDVPTWLSVSPQSGTLVPFGSVEVTVTLLEDVGIGDYSGDFRITGDFCSETNTYSPDYWCFGERFHVEATVRTEEPELDVASWNFDQSMSVVSRIYNGPYASYDEEDIVMAYVEGELRGYGRLDVDISNQLYAFVDVFFDSNESTADGGDGLPVEFHVWDASRGVTFTNVEMYHPTLLDTLDAVRVQPDTIYGQVMAPLLLKTTNRIQQNIELTPGWNWISFNVKSDSLKNIPAAFSTLPTSDILEVKNQTQVATTYEGVWAAVSNSDSLGLDDMFQVKMRTDVPSDTAWTLTLQGPIPDRIADAQSVVRGWNAIGYMAQRELPVEEALLSLWDQDTVLAVNDVIKSRYDGFAMYAGGGEWYGSLTHMAPGQGYKLQLMQPGGAAGDTLGVLYYPADAMTAGYEFRAESPAPVIWESDVQGLEASHNVVASLVLPEYVPETMDDVVGVFRFSEATQQWECVGQSFAWSDFGMRRYFLSAFGRGVDAGSELQFRWYSAFTGDVYVARESDVFAPDGLTGTPEEPLELHFRLGEDANDGMAEAIGSGDGYNATGEVLEVYPNPMVESVTLHYRGADSFEQIRLEDASGKLIRLLDCSELQRYPTDPEHVRDVTCTWDIDGVGKGVYFIHMVSQEGSKRLRIIKM